MVPVDLSGKRTGHTNNHNGGNTPLYANVLLFGELINISSYFIAWKFRGDIPCCRTAGNLKKRLAAMMMKEEDHENGHTDAACNKGK